MKERPLDRPMYVLALKKHNVKDQGNQNQIESFVL